MPIYTRTDLAPADTNFRWSQVLPTVTASNTTTILVMNNSDGTTTRLLGSFTLFFGAVTGGTINTMERRNSAGVLLVFDRADA